MKGLGNGYPMINFWETLFETVTIKNPKRKCQNQRKTVKVSQNHLKFH